MLDKFEILNVEFEVLDVLWDDYFVMLNEVIVWFNDKKDWYEKIVKILLGCLVKKEVLGFEK